MRIQWLSGRIGCLAILLLEIEGLLGDVLREPLLSGGVDLS